MPLIIDGTEMRPCIIAKVKIALGLNDIPPGNTQKCSQEYWDIIVDHIGAQHHVAIEQIEQAKLRVDLFLRNHQ
jgi:hypothetical protein